MFSMMSVRQLVRCQLRGRLRAARVLACMSVVWRWSSSSARLAREAYLVRGQGWCGVRAWGTCACASGWHTNINATRRLLRNQTHARRMESTGRDASLECSWRHSRADMRT